MTGIKSKISSLLRKKTAIALLFEQYENYPRYKPCTLRYENYLLEVSDVLSVLWQLKEVFVDENLKFQTQNSTPVIFDCGSNVGVTCLYFKKLYPGAKITAFEADPIIINLLKQNLIRNGINDITVIDKAVWVDEAGVEFGSEGADSGSIYFPGEKIKVGSVRLKNFLEKENQVELLKMDIEGAEADVITDCNELLRRAKYLFIEYHSWKNEAQRLDEILKVLHENGFRYYMEELLPKKSPFLPGKKEQAMDVQLNIYGINTA